MDNLFLYSIRYFQRIISFTLILFIVLLNGCKDNPSDPGKPETFSVNIKVVSPGGDPLSGMNISFWTKLSFFDGGDNLRSPDHITASSSIRFHVRDSSYVELFLYDINNQLIKEAAALFLKPGAHVYQLSLNDTAGTAVYKCIMTARPDSLSSNILFKDSIYLMLWQPDPAYSFSGRTNSEGIITITDKKKFPHLWNLPQMLRTAETGPEIFGYFDIPDTIVFAVSDESFSTTIKYDYVISEGTNNLTLIWDENRSEKRVVRTPSANTVSAASDSTILEYFYGVAENDFVVLYWETVCEVNNMGFEIQRKGTGDWEAIGFIVGVGTTTEPKFYSFTDDAPKYGTNYYRLKQINFDGTFNYSPVTEVNVGFTLDWELFQNYPNPFN